MRGTIIASFIIVALSISGCYKLQPVSRERLVIKDPSQVWVTTTDFETVVLEKPKFFGDTLVGQVNGQYTELMPGQWQTVRVRTQDTGKTLALVGGVAVGLGMAALLFTGTGGGQTYDSNISCTDEPANPNCQ